MLTRTRSFIGSILNRLPPYSGVRLSISVTFTPRSTRLAARLDPIKPSPPVIRAFFPKSFTSKISSFSTFNNDQIGLFDSSIRIDFQVEVSPSDNAAFAVLHNTKIHEPRR